MWLRRLESGEVAEQESAWALFLNEYAQHSAPGCHADAAAWRSFAEGWLVCGFAGFAEGVTKKAVACATAFYVWCPGEDSNLHGVTR